LPSSLELCYLYVTTRFQNEFTNQCIHVNIVETQLKFHRASFFVKLKE